MNGEGVQLVYGVAGVHALPCQKTTEDYRNEMSDKANGTSNLVTNRRSMLQYRDPSPLHRREQLPVDLDCNGWASWSG